MFDYKGLTDQELRSLCSNSDIPYYDRISSLPFWTTELYGFGKWLRKYAFYPKRFPIFLYSDHSGPSFTNEVFEYDLNFRHAYAMLFHTPEVVAKWNKAYTPKAYTLFSPFVFCRRNSNIKVSPQAKGTLAYPSHTLPDIDDFSDVEKYIADLKALPPQYHPIAVSLHYHDINKGRHNIFIKHGLPVYTAGTPYDYRFADRYYSILRNFKYATSNFIGSYIFYSVEMGIPFFFYGDGPEYKTTSVNNQSSFNIKEINKAHNSSEYIYSLFSGVRDTITDEQRKFVLHQLGINEGIGRIKLSALMYMALFRQFINTRIKRKK
ncbi:hypothetical protein [Longitalea arenae]|uniref:hypothetical protein n=1 Tax=Longitalea arenae TaxID=2812558 RepID=UPI0019674233|nr:hypothetical protein [Longitalea arenae]